MMLDVEPRVFTHDDHASIVHLLAMIAAGQHEWHPSMDVATRADEFAQVRDLKIRALTELLAKTVEASAYPVASDAPTTPVTVDRFEDIVADLALPAVLVVEDGISERSFLLGVARAFKRHRIVTALERKPCWLAVCHAGGTGRMHLFVEQERQNFQVVIRVAALLDSDRKAPHQRTKINDRQLELIGAIDGVTAVHMWQGQEMENYLPMAVWQHHYPYRDEDLDRVRAMAPAKRAYADMKKEFGKPKPIIPAQLDLNEDDFVELGHDAVAEIKRLLSMIEEIL